MSQEGSSIVCRQCSEVISLNVDHCPHCGKSIRGLIWPVVGILFGILLAGASLLNLGDLLVFLVLGVVMGVSSGYLIYDHRRRIQQATERGGFTPTKS